MKALRWYICIFPRLLITLVMIPIGCILMSLSIMFQYIAGDPWWNLISFKTSRERRFDMSNAWDILPWNN